MLSAQFYAHREADDSRLTARIHRQGDGWKMITGLNEIKSQPERAPFKHPFMRQMILQVAHRLRS
jgi:hypothetical protein